MLKKIAVSALKSLGSIANDLCTTAAKHLEHTKREVMYTDENLEHYVFVTGFRGPVIVKTDQPEKFAGKLGPQGLPYRFFIPCPTGGDQLIRCTDMQAFAYMETRALPDTYCIDLNPDEDFKEKLETKISKHLKEGDYKKVDVDLFN